MAKAYRLRLRIVSALLLAGLAVRTVYATPVHPDVRKLLQQPEASPPHFGPARAGWQGPETPAPMQATLAIHGNAQAAREALIAAAVPDRRALIAILAAILILRRLEQWRLRRRHFTRLSPATEEEQEPLAA